MESPTNLPLPIDQAVILAVDDYTPFLDMIQATLEQEGYQVWAASGSEQALDLLLDRYHKLDRVPDLIISDIMMPDTDGYKFFDQVRENPYLNHIPFIFLTAKGQGDDIRRGKELGADDYLCKPCADVDLLAAVRGKLRRIEQHRRLRAQVAGIASEPRGGQNVVVLVIGIALLLGACVLGAFIARMIF